MILVTRLKSGILLIVFLQVAIIDIKINIFTE